MSNEVIVYLLSEWILYILLLIAFLATPRLLYRWNFDHFTSEQFSLENRSYLIMTIIFFVMTLKIFLLPYFVYTIDILSDLVPGAMCGAGIIQANEYGNPLLLLKIMILFLSGFWMTINRLDLRAKDYPFTKKKSWFFIAIFILLTVEIGLDILYFTSIETSQPVTCCSVIFGETGGANAIPMGLDTSKLLLLFYLLYLLIILTAVSQYPLGIILSNILFLFVAYYAVVYFFGTYVYELPTHKCPFCMLQSSYYYIGYLVWSLLLLGVFLGIDYSMVKLLFHQESDRLKWISLLLLTLFVLICTSYVAIYYLKTGVLL
ncbi:MAG: hypothetical protein U9R27_10405 [Campylobacterota bacterium]|nr:hypothetical protein [Campylobacterota bacterium]